jgi:SAM-dependent methyltransferase
MNMSSSIHRFNADTGLSNAERLLWWGANWLNNHYLPNKSQNLIRQQFRPDISQHHPIGDERKHSPSRLMSNLFFEQFDWDSVRSELGQVDVFDSGCGRGILVDRIHLLAGGFSSYMGIDIAGQPEWVELRQSALPVSFEIGDVASVREFIPRKANLFVSQSSLEHFPNDLDYFRQISEHVEQTGNNVIQIHLFPSRACLRLYRFHGLRQYSPRTVSKIAQKFTGKNSYSVLYDIGGRHSNDLHYNFITKPLRSLGVDLRDTETELYWDELKRTIALDSIELSGDPSWYALVIHSNFKRPVFAPNGSL